jgi:hypothetical protein
MLLKTQHVRLLPPNPVQVGTHILAGSPFSTFDSRPSTASGGERGGRAVAGSPEALAAPQLDAEDSVLVANADQRKVFSDRIFKLDDLVL